MGLDGGLEKGPIKKNVPRSRSAAREALHLAVAAAIAATAPQGPATADTAPRKKIERIEEIPQPSDREQLDRLLRKLASRSSHHAQATPRSLRVPIPRLRPEISAEKAPAPETKERAASRHGFIAHELTFDTRGYEGKRIKRGDYHHLRPDIEVKRHLLKLEHLQLHGTLGRFSLDGTPEQILLGRFERALRFKNITDAVENRYNLPPGLILAMLIQESSGADAFPNGRDDGGIGLVHMQPAVAAEFGLATYKNNREMTDKKHGRELRALIEKEHADPIALSKYDDRFNRLLNIDAVGRMLATHMGGRRIPGLGPLRTAFKRYTGRFNYGTYTAHERGYMYYLHDRKFLEDLAKRFDARNGKLVINGTPVGENESAFAAYLKAFWQGNEDSFGLAAYRKLPRYEPEHSADALQTYKPYFLDKQKRIAPAKHIKKRMYKKKRR